VGAQTEEMLQQEKLVGKHLCIYLLEVVEAIEEKIGFPESTIRRVLKRIEKSRGQQKI